MSRKLTKERVSILLSIMFLALTCASSAHTATIMTNQKRVVLDPGHGAHDPGLVSPAGILEQQITFELAELISLELSDTAQVSLTRLKNPPGETDFDATIHRGAGQKTAEQRAAFANQNKADIFVSIHLKQTRSQLSLIFYHDAPHPTVKHLSRQMAEITAERFKDRQNFLPRILKTRIISLENLLMPGILIEPVSISELPDNPVHRKNILIPYAKTIASAIRFFISSQN